MRYEMRFYVLTARDGFESVKVCKKYVNNCSNYMMTDPNTFTYEMKKNPAVSNL